MVALSWLFIVPAVSLTLPALWTHLLGLPQNSLKFKLERHPLCWGYYLTLHGINSSNCQLDDMHVLVTIVILYADQIPVIIIVTSELCPYNKILCAIYTG